MALGVLGIFSKAYMAGKQLIIADNLIKHQY